MYRAGGMSRIVGLDLSLTSTGIVALDENDARVLAAFPLTTKAKGRYRIPDLAQSIVGHIAVDADLVRLWVLEGYGFTISNAATACELGGVVKYLLTRRGAEYAIVPPSTLKKFTTGKGNGKKDQMRLHVFKRWGFEHESNDVVDAYALARVGLAYLGLDPKLTAAQKEAIVKVEVSL